MRSVVLIAYYYPPLSGVAAERSAAFARHLEVLGWRTVVVTARDGHFHRAESTGPEVRVERTRSVELSRLFRAGFASVTGAGASEDAALAPLETGGVGAALRRLAREYVYVPDAQVGWIPFAVHATNRTARELEGTPVLLSSSVPYSAHFAAMRVSRRLGLPWVAELRDPWSTCHPTLRPRSRMRRALDRRFEARVLRRADAVVVTSETTRSGILEAHPDLAPSAVHVVYNGFEPMDRPAGAAAAEGPLELLYAGRVAPGVSVGPLLDAVSALAARRPGSIRLRIVGPVEPWLTKAAELPDHEDWLVADGVASPLKAREAMVRASVNVVLLPGDPHRDRVPGKLFEYLGARRPILAVVPPGSEMEELAVQYGDVRTVGDNEASAIRTELTALIDEHRAGRLVEARITAAAVQSLTRTSQARRMADVLTSVAERRDEA